MLYFIYLSFINLFRCLLVDYFDIKFIVYFVSNFFCKIENIIYYKNICFNYICRFCVIIELYSKMGF